VVVLLCVVVAYAGRTNRLSDQLGNAAIPTTPFLPSALTSPQTRGGDTLVRPSLATTQVGTTEYLQPIQYEVQPGDTVANLADRFSISESTIRWANQLSADSELRPGQLLIIPPVSGVVYTVLPGDTVSAIARRFQSDSAAIVQFNPVSDSSLLTPGMQVIVPGGRLEDAERPGLTSRSLARPRQGEAESNGGTSSPPLMQVPTSSAESSRTDSLGIDVLARVPFSARIAPAPPLAPIVYQVTPGDTLWSVSREFGVSADSIALASGLAGNEDSLKIDQKLLIPPVPGVIHVVQDGDTLEAIAQRYGADQAQTANANGLVDPYPLKVGQTLVVPGGKVPAIPPATQTTYVVRDGDTITNIGSTYGVDPQAVVSANGLADPDVLQPGQALLIPALARAMPAVARLPPAASDVPAPPAVIAAPVAAPKPVAPAVAASPPSNDGWTVVAVASKYLGTPYVWGGTSPAGFDCSGFIWYIYRHAGYPVPRDLWGQLQSGLRVSRGNLQPGDIVFFANTYQPGLSHGGIYIGGGRVISAVDYGVGVAVISLSNPYWSSRYFGATRPW